MDALLITDVSAQTALLLFAVIAVFLAALLAGVLIAFGWVLKCTIETMVKRSMKQSATNGDALLALTERVDALHQDVERLLKKRGSP